MEWLNYISALIGMLGLGGGALLFYGSKKKSAEAKSKEDKVNADLKEISAYLTRIENLSQTVDELSRKVACLRKDLFSADEEIERLRAALKLAEIEVEKRQKLIESLKANKATLEDQIKALEIENAELTKKNEVLKKRISNLKKSNREDFAAMKQTEAKAAKAASKKAAKEQKEQKP
jgi:chromosome segregation ATPase